MERRAIPPLEYFHPPLPLAYIRLLRPSYTTGASRRDPMRKTILRAYKTELDPNRVQRLQFVRHTGAARFAYNWGLERVQAAYGAGTKVPSYPELHRELNRQKKTELAWMYEVSKCAPQEALRDLEKAYARFLKNRQKLAIKARKRKREPRRDGMPWGFPRFKSRKRGIGSLRLTGHIHAFDKAIHLPRIGQVRLEEKGYLPTEGVHVFSATVSERAGRWFVSLQVEQEIEVPENHGPVVGIDLGISRLITVSDGTFIENPRALPRYERKRKRLDRALARKRPGSRKREKTRRKQARLEFRISNIRRDALHKATTWLARTKSAIGVETLGIGGMMQNHSLAGSIADASWGECIRQLRYKAELYGSQLVPVDRFFPSSHRCSRCGALMPKMPLDQRWFKCGLCGFEEDRELNAALNNRPVAASWAETLNARESQEVTAPRAVALVAVPGGEAGTESGHIWPYFGQR